MSDEAPGPIARETAIVAAHQAVDAAAELLRFAREGAACNWPFGDAEPLEKLAEALKIALEIELEHIECQTHPDFADEKQMKGQMLAACTRFIEGWAG